MSASMKAYLAANYMSGPKADAILARTEGPKRKKRKTASRAHTTGTNAKASSSSSMIKDEDILGWGADPKTHSDEEDTSEAVVASDRGFKKKQRAEQGSGWATVRPGDNDTTPPEPADEQPLVVAEEEEPFKGGLMTAAQMKKTFGKSRASKDELSKEEIEAAQETIYRDASGKKIDTAVERAEAARRKREKEEREAKKMEWGKGLVQREEAEKKRKEAEDLKGKAFARGVDDVDMNAAMKAEERWNDPAAAFLSKKRSKGPRKPEYTGPMPPPNRFGIKPGYRWDGVDRGNGFEKSYFQRQNENKRRGAESYQWGVDDM